MKTLTFEEIVGLVKEYEEKDAEVKRLEATVRSCQSSLKRFADTGNMHIDVIFDHGGRESIYPKDMYPSDTVKEAIIADIQKHINRLNKKQDELLTRLLEIKTALGE